MIIGMHFYFKIRDTVVDIIGQQTAKLHCSSKIPHRCFYVLLTHSHSLNKKNALKISNPCTIYSRDYIRRFLTAQFVKERER